MMLMGYVRAHAWLGGSNQPNRVCFLIVEARLFPFSILVLCQLVRLSASPFCPPRGSCGDESHGVDWSIGRLVDC